MYYQKQIEEILQACQTSKNGLTQEEVKNRHQEYGYNVLDEKERKSFDYLFQTISGFTSDYSYHCSHYF